MGNYMVKFNDKITKKNSKINHRWIIMGTYGSGKTGFAYSKGAGREVAALIKSYNHNGYSYPYTLQNPTKSEVKSLISELKSNKWIDEQSVAIIVESNYLHKSSGMYIMHYVTTEFLLDHYNIEVFLRFITPVFATKSQILYTVLALVASLFMIFFSVFDLK